MTPLATQVRAGPTLFREVPELLADDALLAALDACVTAQRAAGAAFRANGYRPRADAAQVVSEAALRETMTRADTARDIVEDRALSNCIAFNFDNVQGAVEAPDLARRVDELTRLVATRLAQLAPGLDTRALENSGNFWYPPGGYMGWHTNLRTPGWRLYLTRADEPGRSFFRYRDPVTGEIVTARDAAMNARLFHVTPAAPFWHAVYSDTDRFSLGFKVPPPA